MKRILIVSDTHGNEEWLNLLNNNYDLIIHAGDHLLNNQIEAITPYYVDGNNDWQNKNINKFNIEDLSFVLIHGDEQKVSGVDKIKIHQKLNNLIDESKPDILIFGHTHIPFLSKFNNTVIINPGSMAYCRHNFKKSYVELTIDNNKIIDLEFKYY